MFNRQWFPHRSQYGLTREAQQFNKQLLTKNFTRLSSHISLNYTNNREYWSRQFLRLRHITNKHNTCRKPIYIYWDCFWPTFSKIDNQFLDFFKQALPGHEIFTTEEPSRSDISIYSCYGNYASLQLTKHTTRVLFLGENVRPCYSDFDFSISFDCSTYSGLNYYFPLWFLELDHFDKQYPDRLPYDKYRFTKSKTVDLSSRKKFIAYVGNNNEPFRINLISTFESHNVTVDCYGSHTNPIEDKLHIYQQYKYILCPENSFYPGYVTEKIMHGYLSSGYFIYWGGVEGTDLSNPESLILVNPYSNLDPIIQRIKYDEYPDKLTISPLMKSSYISYITAGFNSFVQKLANPYLI